MNPKVADKLTNQVLAELAKGVNPWKKAWKNLGGIAPFNAESGRRYRGFNAMICAMSSSGRVPAFTTASRASGRFPKKGSKSIALIRPLIKKEHDANGVEREKFYGIGYVNVFSIYDIQGYKIEALEAKYPATELNELEKIERAEKIIEDRENPSAISFGGDRAFYMPSKDSITVPMIGQFQKSSEYYSTLFHEIAHSTGHFTRLDRKDGMENIKFGSEPYSFEELIAELTSAFLCAECQIEDEDTFTNSVAYLQGWIKKLQNDPEMIIKASSQALKAANYIMNVK